MGVPRAIVGETRSTLKRRRWERGRAIVGKGKARTNADQPRRAEGIPLAEGEPEGRTSGGATAFQPPSWDFFSHKPLGADSGIVEPLGKRERRPQTPPRRAFWGNDLEGTNTGTLLARSPKRRGAAGADSFFSLSLESANARPRQERDKPPTSHRTSQQKRKGRTTRLATHDPTDDNQDNLEHTTKSARAQPSAGRLAANAADAAGIGD